ncbi:MAG: SCO family protein, partial [Candidatus Hydrogenedentes bacterium]|nr:SCO family protein [Candidatus Hydrogenedentota bacterium]
MRAQALALVLAVSSLSVACARPEAPEVPVPPILSQIPDFKLTDSFGREFTRGELTRPWVASFIFTRCTAQCPMLTSRMKA